jgi:phosphatidylserine/phosphatidylglycerophosphate/cardiolipin synthase-like enzyme
MIKSYFNQIRSNIIKEISKAENEILIAVYWFTNQELFNILIEKLKEGVQIELIIHNDFINNRESGLPFQEFIENGGKFYFSDGNNPMHNKFCVIDKKVLINGSYNWTYFAEALQRQAEGCQGCVPGPVGMLPPTNTLPERLSSDYIVWYVDRLQ